MRHRRRGRKLGRSPKHQRALLRNLASALILTERDAEMDDNAPTVKGRIVTTLHKAKEVRPLVEKCVTIARRALPHREQADALDTKAERNSDGWKAWRHSDKWHEWNKAAAPVVAARRRLLRLLGNKQAVRVLFDEIAPRFEDRSGGYTRILELATPRLGDAGRRAILEFVGVHDREQRKAQKPSFEPEAEEPTAETEAAESETAETEAGPAADETEPAGAEAEDQPSDEDAPDDEEPSAEDKGSK